jgi:hypothetical protein
VSERQVGQVLQIQAMKTMEALTLLTEEQAMTTSRTRAWETAQGMAQYAGPAQW